MTKSMTLIELIFSMVIIAIAFTVFPKILQVSAKTAKTTLKEEAMYNAVALIGLIKSLPWDEKNTEYDDILLVDNGDSDYECSYLQGGIYRIGGFLGSRNCRNKEQASNIDDDGDDPYDDIDDFDGYGVEATNEAGKRAYELNVSVRYIADIVKEGGAFSITASSQSTNTKYIDVNCSVKKLQNVLGEHIASFWYVSSNIGQLRINRVRWRH